MLRYRLLDAMDPEKMFSDNALISVAGIGDQYYAMCETPFMLQVNPETLETQERVSIFYEIFHGLLPVIFCTEIRDVFKACTVALPTSSCGMIRIFEQNIYMYAKQLH